MYVVLLLQTYETMLSVKNGKNINFFSFYVCISNTYIIEAKLICHKVDAFIYY